MEVLILFSLMLLFVILIITIVQFGRVNEALRTLDGVKYELKIVKEKLNTLLGKPGGVNVSPQPPVEPKAAPVKSPTAAQTVAKMPEKKATTFSDPLPAAKPQVKLQKVDENSFGARTSEVFRKIWNYIIVGEEFRNPELSAEYAVATTWLIRGGTLVLIFGLAYFLKYSIERDLITPMTRVCLSAACGVGLCAVGLYGLNKKYHIASTAALLIGLITLYLTSYYAYKWHGILTEGQALAAMVTFSALAIAIASWKRIFAGAFFGMIGGYLVYSLIWPDRPDYFHVALYFTAINFAVMAVKRQYSWTVINFLTLAFYIIFSIMFRLSINNYPAILAVMGVNYLLFSLMPLGKKEHGDNIFEIVIILINLCHYLLFSLYYFDSFTPKSYKISALFVLTLAVVNFLQYLWVRKSREGETQLMYTYCGIAIAMLGISIPLFFEAEFVVAGIWAVLGFAMIFAAGKKGEKLMYVAAFIFYLASLNQILAVNLIGGYCLIERLFSTGVLIVSLLGAAEMQRRRGKQWIFLAVVGFVLLFIYSSTEIFIQAKDYLYGFRHGVLSVWWAIWGVAMLASGIVYRTGALRRLGLLLLFGCIIKVFILDLARLATIWRTVAFVGLGTLLFAGALIYIKFKSSFEADDPTDND